MLRPSLRRALLRTAARRVPWATRYSTVSKTSDPLRVLFCGSDEFSCASLQALYDEQKQNSELIRSIDVLVRPAKPTGRGNRIMKDVPLRALAEQLRLPIHVRDTFKGWDMPKPAGDPINLIIAVSFGLFVPQRLLRESKYGGINVHPSLLPDLRGPAPIHHALLAERSHTGITVQTLSPTSFDAGAILLQTPPPGTPIPPACTFQQLHDLLAPAGARMLVEALRQGLHVHAAPPYGGAGSPPAAAAGEGQEEEGDNRPVSAKVGGVVAGEDGSGLGGLRYAGKITTADRQVWWTRSVAAGRGHGGSARGVALQARVLGPLWTYRSVNGVEKRVILQDVEEAVSPWPTSEVVDDDDQGRGGSSAEKGLVAWVLKPREKDTGGGKSETVTLEYVVEGSTGAVLVRMPDMSCLRVGRILVEGSTSKPASSVLRRKRL